jgi:ATP-dependent helicase/nuclease subunit A
LWAPVRHVQETATRAARALANDERDREYQRLLYVAMTRARDRLYVCGHATAGRQPTERCWYETVRRGLAGVAEPVEIAVEAIGSVGWRGSGLRLATPQEREIPHPETRSAEPAPLPWWARRPAPAEPVLGRPLAPSRAREDEPAPLSPLGDDGGREFRRGVVIHRLLETLPGLPPEARPAAARRFLARPVLALSEPEQQDIAAEAIAVLARPEVAELFGPHSRAEVPIVGVVGDDAISGRIDRLAIGEGWIKIVDYKTNRPIPADSSTIAPAYLRQLALYRAAIARIYPGFSITCGILWTASPRLDWVDGSRLDGLSP